RQTLPRVAWQPIPPSARPSCSPATGTGTAAPPVRRQRRRRSSPARAWRRPGGCADAMAESFDVLVLGAGAAGLMCAITAGRRDRRVLVVEHANKPGKKILMSGGGRCNFTNTGTAPENFLSANPHYCKSALARYTPADFIAMVERHGIGYHEKELGQLFCDQSSRQIVRMLLDECEAAGVRVEIGCGVEDVRQDEGGGFALRTSRGSFTAASLVVASGGLSIPSM